MLERHAEDCGGENGMGQRTVTVVKSGNVTAIVFHSADDFDDIQVGEEVEIKGNVSGRF